MDIPFHLHLHMSAIEFLRHIELRQAASEDKITLERTSGLSNMKYANTISRHFSIPLVSLVSQGMCVSPHQRLEFCLTLLTTFSKSIGVYSYVKK